MKNISISFTLAVSLSAILLLIAQPLKALFGLDADWTKQFSAIPILAIPQLADMIELRRAKRSISMDLEPEISDLNGFLISWVAVLATGIVLLPTICQLSSAFGAMIMALFLVATNKDALSQLDSNIAGAAGLISIPIQITGAFMYGKWVGARCRNYGIIVLIMATIFGGTVSVGIDYALTPSDVFSRMYNTDKGIDFYIKHSLSLSALWAVPGLIGFWRGRKWRLTRYMHYLLSVLPSDTASVLVDITHEEARKVIAAQKVHK